MKRRDRLGPHPFPPSAAMITGVSLACICKHPLCIYRQFYIHMHTQELFCLYKEITSYIAVFHLMISSRNHFFNVSSVPRLGCTVMYLISYIGPLLMDVEVASGCFAINGRALDIPPHTLVYICQYFLRIDSRGWNLLEWRIYALYIWADIVSFPFRQARPTCRLPNSGLSACRLWFVQVHPVQLCYWRPRVWALWLEPQTTLWGHVLPGTAVLGFCSCHCQIT